MPNRIVRQSILDSDRVNSLSWAGEVFYRRLMSVVDDFGRYDGRVPLIRSQLYPLKLNQVSDADVGKWLGECSSAGLVSIYEVEGKEYLEINNFQQTLRIKKSKFPAPDIICKHMQADDNHTHLTRMSETKRNETESETEIETRSEARGSEENFSKSFLQKNVPSQAQIEKAFIDSGLSESEGAEFYLWVKGAKGWQNIESWPDYTAAVILQKLQKQKLNGESNNQTEKTGKTFGSLRSD